MLRLPPSTSLLHPPSFLRHPPSSLAVAAFPSTNPRPWDMRSTVDYEGPPSSKWTAIYRRVSLMKNPRNDASKIIRQWELEKRKLSKWEVIRIAKELRKFRRYKLALDVYEWMSSEEERFDMNASDNAVLIDLIAKTKGVKQAEENFICLPAELKDKRTYGALLNAYAHAREKEKTLNLLETMKNKGFASECLVYNVVMTMYMRLREFDKVISLIDEMRGKNIKLDSFSYNIWITSCAALGKEEEMGRILELMDNTDETMISNWTTYTTLATMHIKLGKLQKAAKFLMEAESRSTGTERKLFDCLIDLYCYLGKKDDVYRIWQRYKSKFRTILNSGYRSMITAMIRLYDIKEAESLYDEWLSSSRNHDPSICNLLVYHYMKNDDTTKAQHCLDKLIHQGGSPSPATCELLARSYMSQMQLSEALNFLCEAASIAKPLGKIWKPKPLTVVNFVALCEKQGDLSSIQSLIKLLTNMGCLDQYNCLVPHVNAAR